jgi:hypothetical protein
VDLASRAARVEAGIDATAAVVVAAELVLEGLVAKRRISRSDAGAYSRRRDRPRPPHAQGSGGPPWTHET